MTEIPVFCFHRHDAHIAPHGFLMDAECLWDKGPVISASSIAVEYPARFERDREKGSNQRFSHTAFAADNADNFF